MKPDLAIIIPVYNEAGNIASLAREIEGAFESRTESWNLWFVDDASTDATWSEIQAEHERDPRIQGLRHASNSGQSAAVWTGIRQTASRLVATLDGDGQNDPADLPKMVDALQDADCVCGWRVNRQDDAIRKWASAVARWFRQATLASPFHDTGCGLRVFRRECVEGCFGFNGLHRFLPILVQDAGFRVREIPVHHRPRQAGISKYGIGNRLGRGIHDLFAMRWYQQRRYRARLAEETSAHPPTVATPTRTRKGPRVRKPSAPRTGRQSSKTVTSGRQRKRTRR